MDFTLSTTLGILGDAVSSSTASSFATPLVLMLSPTTSGGRRRRLALCSTAPCFGSYGLTSSSSAKNTSSSSSEEERNPTDEAPSSSSSSSLQQQPVRMLSICSGLFCSLDALKGPQEKHRDDDDTASTMSTATATSVDEDDCSCNDESVQHGASCHRVQFCEPLVTAVYTRPVTSQQDKYYLYYSEHDYLDFKLDYLYGGTTRIATPSSYYYKRSVRRVKFERDVVTSVHPVLDAKQRQDCDLYYSESELQTFLDDFVASLSSSSTSSCP